MRGVIVKIRHKEIIQDYFFLNSQINHKKALLNELHIEFYSRNFCGGTDFYDPIGIRSKGFNVESEVTYYVDNTAILEKKLKVLERKYEHFKRFRLSLDNNDYRKLLKKYTKSNDVSEIVVEAIDKIALDEILEIEEAVSYEFGTLIPFDLTKEIVNVESLNADTVEDSFQAVSALLGV